MCLYTVKIKLLNVHLFCLSVASHMLCFSPAKYSFSVYTGAVYCVPFVTAVAVAVAMVAVAVAMVFCSSRGRLGFPFQLPTPPPRNV